MFGGAINVNVEVHAAYGVREVKSIARYVELNKGKLTAWREGSRRFL